MAEVALLAEYEAVEIQRLSQAIADSRVNMHQAEERLRRACADLDMFLCSLKKKAKPARATRSDKGTKRKTEEQREEDRLRNDLAHGTEER